MKQFTIAFTNCKVFFSIYYELLELLDELTLDELDEDDLNSIVKYNTSLSSYIIVSFIKAIF